MKNWGKSTWHWWHHPNPVCRTTTSDLMFFFEMLNKLVGLKRKKNIIKDCCQLWQKWQKDLKTLTKVSKFSKNFHMKYLVLHLNENSQKTNFLDVATSAYTDIGFIFEWNKIEKRILWVEMEGYTNRPRPIQPISWFLKNWQILTHAWKLNFFGTKWLHMKWSFIKSHRLELQE